MRGKKLPISAASRSASSRNRTRGCSPSRRASSTTSPCRPISCRRCSTRRTSSSRNTPSAASSLGRGVQPAHQSTRTSTWRIRSSAATRKEKIALRRAISMAYNIDDEIRVIRLRVRRCRRRSRFRPTSSGYDPNFKGNAQYDVAGGEGAARQVRLRRSRRRRLARSARRQAAEAHRWRPTRRAIYRQFDELWQAKHECDRHPHRVPQAEVSRSRSRWRVAGQLQMWGLANTLVNDAGLQHSATCSTARTRACRTSSRFDLPEFNELYDKAQRLPDGPERVQLFRRMSQLVTAYAPWVLQYLSHREHRSSSRGCSATSTTASTSIRGCTTTSTSRSAKAGTR